MVTKFNLNIVSPSFIANVEKLIIVAAAVGDISEDDCCDFVATRDVSNWSKNTRRIYENVYGDDLPALWAAFIDRYMEYLVRILNI